MVVVPLDTLIAPPCVVALLPVKVEPVIDRESDLEAIAPPLLALLFVKVEFVTTLLVSALLSAKNAPPADPEVLPVNVESSIVIPAKL